MGRLIGFAAVLLSLAACEPSTGLLAVTANVVSVVNTDKTLVDHAASWATGEDCSAVALSSHEDYCQTAEVAVEPAAAAPNYCYRSLGSIVCYSEPDPYASDERLVR